MQVHSTNWCLISLCLLCFQGQLLLRVWSLFFLDCSTSALSPSTKSPFTPDQRSRYKSKSLSDEEGRHSKKSAKNNMSVMCKNGPSNSVFLYVRFFLGCMFHSTGIHIHDHEPNIHWAWLDEWRKAQSWWPLKCNPPNPTSTAAHCCTPPPLLWMGRRTQHTARSFGGTVFINHKDKLLWQETSFVPYNTQVDIYNPVSKKVGMLCKM